MFVKENYSQWMTYILSASFGTWPLFPTNVYSTSNEIQTASKISRKTKSWLRRYTICTIWLLITVWNHTYYIMHSWMERDKLEKNIKISKYDAIAKKLLVVENWTFNLAAIINISTTLFTSQYIPTIFCSLEKVEKWIESVKGKWILTKIRKTELGRSVSWLLSIYSVIFITMALEYSGLLAVHRDAQFFNIIIQDLGKLSMTTFDLQFSNLCGYLEKLFYTINDILLEIKSAIENKEEISNPRNRKFNRKSIRFFNVVTRYPEIREINNKHAVLCELIGKINSIYQIQITLNIAACFFNTVCVLFTTISEYRANTDWTLWISGLLWVTYYILRIIMICASAAGVSDEANKSRMHLSCINNRSLDGKQKYEIEQFLRRLSATDIKFVLCNLMTVNTPLLTSAGVGVTTYLVIALQYTYT